MIDSHDLSKNNFSFRHGKTSLTLVAKSGKGKDHYVIGPGHTGVWTDKKGRSFISFHYYDGRRDGNSWIAEKNLRFNKQGWPVVAGKAKRTFPMKKKKSN